MSLIISKLFILFFLYIIKCSKINFSINPFHKNSTSFRNLNENDNQKLNNIINIYNPYNIVSYISSKNDYNGDLFITTNTEEKNSPHRLVYALKSDGTNYFSGEESYKIYNISLDNVNLYPMITPITIKNKKSLLTLSHLGHFETFDLSSLNWFSRDRNRLMRENSLIFKNTMVHLKNYNYSNIILNAYVEKGRYLLNIEKHIFKHINLTKSAPDNINRTLINPVQISLPVTCFEMNELIACLYSNGRNISYGINVYTITVFDVFNLTIVFNTTLDDNSVNNEELFSKCIYLKDYIGAFIYFLNYDSQPKLVFKKVNVRDSFSLDYELVNYLGPITINSNDNYFLGNNYIYNDIIKMDDFNLVYVNTDSDSDKITIVLIKLLNNDKNVLLSYFQIDLTTSYNLKIYRDMTVFKLKEFLGIGMTHYNLSLSQNNTYSSYFVIGLGTSNDISFDTDIFNKSIKISDLLINIENNIFGYSSIGIRLITPLDEEMGFYILNNQQNKINTNESISLNDELTFRINNGSCALKNIYIINYESIITEANYDNLVNNYSNSVEYYPTNENDLSSYYNANIFYGKKATISLNVNKCYKTCETCYCYGTEYRHFCLTCSNSYPYFYNETDDLSNCLKKCPDNYESNADNICVLKIETTIILTTTPYIPTTIITTIPTTQFFIPTTQIENGNIITTVVSTEFIKESIPTTIIMTIPTTQIITPTTQLENENIVTTNILTTQIDKESNIISTIEENYNDNTNEADCSSNNNNKLINQICYENFKDILINIKNISENNIILNGSANSLIYGYEIGKNSEEFFEDNNLIYVNFINGLDDIKNNLNLGNETKLYLLIVDTPSKYQNSSSNDFSFFLLLENGTELNISDFSNIKINISVPMTNIDLLNYDYATYFAEQGYDIYNLNSNFYNDLCTSAFLGDNDITLEDRLSEIFPSNISLNKNNCTYKASDLENKRFQYECDLTGTYNSEDSSEEVVQEHNFFKYFLDLINYKIITCKNLIYDYSNYKNNIGVIICIIDSFLTVPFIILFYIRGIYKIRINLYNSHISTILIPSNDKNKKKYKGIKTVNLNKNIKIQKKSNKLISAISNKTQKKKEIKNSKSINKKQNDKKKKDKNEKNNQSKMRKDKNEKRNKNKKKKSNPVRKKNNNKINLNNKQINFSNSKDLTNINIISHKSTIKLILPQKIKYKKINIINDGKTKKLNKISTKSEDLIKVNIDPNDYDELPYKTALRIDKRNVFKSFFLKLIEKFEIIDIFVNKNVKSILLSRYFLYLLIDFWLNAFLYSDDVVSHKSHNDGSLEFAVVLTITLSSKIISSIIQYFLNQLIDFEEKFKLIAEIRKEYAFLRILKKFFKEIAIKVFIFMLIEIGIIIFCFYYLLLFCAIYSKSQKSLITNYLMSIVETLIICFSLAFIIIAFRKFGLALKNKYLYNTSKYLDIHF